MFKKIIVRKTASIIATLTLSTAGLLALSPLAYSDGIDTGSCVVMVNDADPSIHGVRGACTPEFVTRSTRPLGWVAPEVTTIAYTTNIKIGINKPEFANQDVRITASRLYGPVLVDVTVRTDAKGYAAVSMIDSGSFPVQDGYAALPQYDTAVLAGRDSRGNYTYGFGGTLRGDNFDADPNYGSDTDTYSLTGSYVLDNGAIWTKR